MPPVNRKNPIRAESSDSRYSLMEFNRQFPDDAACLEWLWRNRYSPDGEEAYCPKCANVCVFKRYNTAQQRQSWTCNGCGHHVHPTAGTIFHKSSTSLHLWFYAIYLMTSTRCGISAKQLERELGCTYKTAWRMAFLIRNDLMKDDGEPLRGFVEADETFVGGKEYPGRYRTGEKRGGPANSKKVPVLGIVERQGGRVKAMPVANVRAGTLMPRVIQRVLPASIIYTDESGAYNGLTRHGYLHRRIHHAEKVYVSGDIHTNTIEGFWSLVKRGIGGVYHAVSAKHLQGYLNEYAWRYNHRNSLQAQFELALLRAARSL